MNQQLEHIVLNEPDTTNLQQKATTKSNFLG